MITTTHNITKNNIQKETFYNICKIAYFTRFAMPCEAIKDGSFSLRVLKDECGNIVALKFRKQP
jgi:hypothetical protein